MSGYVATARIRGATPRLVEAGSHRWASDADFAPPRIEAVPVVVPGAGDTIDPPPPTLPERWTSFRERWSQLTFYLLDAESWR